MLCATSGEWAYEQKACSDGRAGLGDAGVGILQCPSTDLTDKRDHKQPTDEQQSKRSSKRTGPPRCEYDTRGINDRLAGGCARRRPIHQAAPAFGRRSVIWARPQTSLGEGQSRGTSAISVPPTRFEGQSQSENNRLKRGMSPKADRAPPRYPLCLKA
jgi:hypothetical protein